MDISVVIVNYRVKFFLEQTLRSVFESLEGISGEVIVVDNNSCDDSIEFVKSRFPEVRFIENAENVGFARANNQAIMQAQGDYTVILNPDTVLCRESLSGCMDWMRSHEQCGAIGIRMVDGNGVFLPESKRAFPTPWVSFCKIFGLSSLFPRSPRFAKYHLRYLSDREPHKVDILSGAYMFCRTSLLKRLGGFDEDFFMYGEDIDLSYCIVQAGYENWFLPLPMIHYKGESTKKDSFRYVCIFYDAMLIFYRKHFPRYSWLFYPIIKLGVLVRASLAMLKRGVKRLFGKKQSQEQFDEKPWVILSDNTMAVTIATGINHFKKAVPSQGDYHVLIDDGCHTYSEIVHLISDTSREGLSFHIYSSRNGIIITPKMSRQ